MTDAYPLRPVAADEFPAWARMIAGTYGNDLSDADVARERTATELTRTLGAFDGPDPVGGTAAFSRALTVPGGADLPVAGVTWVGVAPTHRRRGILTAMMRRQLTELHTSHGESVAVLRPSEAAIYGRFGYGPATYGAQLRCDTRAMTFRPDTDHGDGRIRLLDRAQARPLVESLYAQARGSGTGTGTGWPDRPERAWDTRLFDDPAAREGGTSLRFAVHTDAAGRPTGYALYRIRTGRDALGGNLATLRLVELTALTSQAHACLWRFLAGVDLVPWIEAEAAVDDPLPHLLTDPRAIRGIPVDRLWVRLVDLPRALAGRRYAVPVDVVLDVEDAFCPWNSGSHRLQAGEDGSAVCERTTAPADLRVTTADLAAAYLGGTTLAALAATGRVHESRPGALARASAAFQTPRAPYYPGGWAFPAY